jgi:hypothetical protein
MICHGEDMRLGLLSAAPPVHVDVFSRVDWQWAVWVNCNQEQSGVGLDDISSALRSESRLNVHISGLPGTACGDYESPRARSGA